MSHPPQQDTLDVREVEGQRLNVLSFDEAQVTYSEIAGAMAGDTLRATHKAQNYGKGITQSQYIETATTAFMELGDVLNTPHAKWLDAAANV